MKRSVCREWLLHQKKTAHSANSTNSFSRRWGRRLRLRTDLAMRKALDLVKGAANKPAKKAKKADGAEGEGDEAEEKPAKKKTASKGKGKAASDSEEN